MNKVNIERTFTNEKIHDGAWREMEFDGCTFTDCNFENADFIKTSFVECEFVDCNLTNIKNSGNVVAE